MKFERKTDVSSDVGDIRFCSLSILRKIRMANIHRAKPKERNIVETASIPVIRIVDGDAMVLSMKEEKDLFPMTIKLPIVSDNQTMEESRIFTPGMTS